MVVNFIMNVIKNAKYLFLKKQWKYIKMNICGKNIQFYL